MATSQPMRYNYMEGNETPYSQEERFMAASYIVTTCLMILLEFIAATAVSYAVMRAFGIPEDLRRKTLCLEMTIFGAMAVIEAFMFIIGHRILGAQGTAMGYFGIRGIVNCIIGNAWLSKSMLFSIGRVLLGFAVPFFANTVFSKKNGLPKPWLRSLAVLAAAFAVSWALAETLRWGVAPFLRGLIG